MHVVVAKVARFVVGTDAVDHNVRMLNRFSNRFAIFQIVFLFDRYKYWLVTQRNKELMVRVKMITTHQEPNLSQITDQFDRSGIPDIASSRYDELCTFFAESVAQNATHHTGSAENRGHIAAKRRSSTGAFRKSSHTSCG